MHTSLSQTVASRTGRIIRPGTTCGLAPAGAFRRWLRRVFAGGAIPGLCAVALFAPLSLVATEQQANFEQRLAQQEAALKANPGNPIHLLRLAELHLEAGEREKALPLLKQLDEQIEAARKAGVSTARLHHVAGLSAMYQGKTDAAIQSFEASLALDPANTAAILHLARLHAEAGTPETAIHLLQSALEHEPSNEQLRGALALLYKKMGKQHEALEAFEALHRDFPDNPIYFNHLLDLYLALGDAENAGKALDELVAAGKTTEAEKLVYLAQMHMDHDDLRPVPRLLARARKLDSDNPALAACYSRYYATLADEAINSNNPERAILFWIRALEHDPTNLAINLRLGNAYMEEKDFAAASRYFENVLALQPLDPDYYANYADALFALGKFDAALYVLELGRELAANTSHKDWADRLAALHASMLRKTGPTAGDPRPAEPASP